MRKRTFDVVLSEHERKFLKSMLSGGRMSVLEIRRAQILLKSDNGENGPGISDKKIAQDLDCSTGFIFNTRKNFVVRGFDNCLKRKKQEKVSRSPALDGRGEAHLITLACSEPPSERSGWTLRMLASRLVELEICDGISYETVRRVLKKHFKTPLET
jgi:hypothetical protein